MADDQQLGYSAVAAHLGIRVRTPLSRKSRRSLPEPDDTSVPDRPRWRPATFQSGTRASSQLPGPDFHRQTTTSSRIKINYVTKPPSCWACERSRPRDARDQVKARHPRINRSPPDGSPSGHE